MSFTKAQTVVITGASGGVGRAVAQAYGKRGANVALIARGERGLAQADKDVQNAGGQALPLQVDVADYAAVDTAASRVEEELGPIDVWINAAFSSVFATFADTSMEEFRRATEVSYLGFVHGTHAALARMRPRDRGTVVQVGSALAYRGIPLQSAYCGAKHAIQGFHASLRGALLHANRTIHVTIVQLPAVNTPQFSWVLSKLPRRPQPVPPIYQPELAARAILRAADKPQRREYWVGSSTTATLIANAVAPGVLDRYLARTGFDAQQTEQRRTPDAQANLWQPVDRDRDYGAHGRFDDRAHGRDPQAWASRHHAGVAALGAGIVAMVAAALRRKRP